MGDGRQHYDYNASPLLLLSVSRLIFVPPPFYDHAGRVSAHTVAANLERRCKESGAKAAATVADDAAGVTDLGTLASVQG